MREILFRGKTYNDKWVQGLLVQMGDRLTLIRKLGSDGIGYYDYSIFPSTIGQYTGLTDKNGKKIFEGDIIRQKGFLNNYYTSVWYASGRFLVKDYETLLPTELGGISRYKIEVIGNIHDNPELLEVTE